uniref:ENT domain-containing protein n=1 Tax=Macrostomum lignano TaxID=282301 RepID=A0A1I8JIF4_9PLAT
MKLLFEQLDRGEVTLAEARLRVTHLRRKAPPGSKSFVAPLDSEAAQPSKKPQAPPRQCRPASKRRRYPNAPIRQDAPVEGHQSGVDCTSSTADDGAFAGFQQPVILADATAEQMYHATDQLIPTGRCSAGAAQECEQQLQLDQAQLHSGSDCISRSSLVSDCKAYQHLYHDTSFHWYSDSHYHHQAQEPPMAYSQTTCTLYQHQLQYPQQQQQQQQHPPEFNYHQHDQQLWYDEAATIQFQQQLQPHPGSTAVELHQLQCSSVAETLGYINNQASIA